MPRLEITSGQPLPLLETVIEPAWVSRLGHMRAAQYVALFDDAIMVMLPGLGLTDAALRHHGTSPFLTDLHATYLRELTGGERIAIAGQVLEADARRARLILVMSAGPALAATCELLVLNMDLATRKPAAWSPAQAEIWERLRAAHAPLPHPPTAGRAITAIATPEPASARGGMR